MPQYPMHSYFCQCLKRKRALSMEMEPDDSLSVEPSRKVREVSFVDSYAVRRSAPEDLVELAREIQEADNTIKITAVGKLEVIAEQMRFLREQAQRILEDAKISHNLNHAHCNFKRVPGHLYHLYVRPNGQNYFSMIAPAEWGSEGPPHKHLGSYRLEHDRSWTPVAEIAVKDKSLVPLTKLLGGLDSIGYTPMDH